MSAAEFISPGGGAPADALREADQQGEAARPVGRRGQLGQGARRRGRGTRGGRGGRAAGSRRAPARGRPPAPAPAARACAAARRISAALPSKSPTVGSIWARAIRAGATLPGMIHWPRDGGARPRRDRVEAGGVRAPARDLEQAGFAVDVAPPGRRAAARSTRPATRWRWCGPRPGPSSWWPRSAGPIRHLAVVVLFFDEEEAAGYPGRLGADGALVGPLTAPAGGRHLRAWRPGSPRRGAAGRAARRPAPRERPRAPHDLAFLKRLLLRRGEALAPLRPSPSRWRWSRSTAGRELSEQLDAPSRASLLGELTGLVAGAIRDIDIAVPFATTAWWC